MAGTALPQKIVSANVQGQQTKAAESPAFGWQAATRYGTALQNDELALAFMLTLSFPQPKRTRAVRGRRLMADENSTGLNTEVTGTDATAKAPAPKKQRAPRRQKVAAETTVAAPPAKTAKVPSGRRKRGEQGGEAKPMAVETQVIGKSPRKDAVRQTGRKRLPKQIEQTASASVSAMDEMADLIKLEEENKRLRKTLADKLRAENADLRKRLGLD